MNNTYITEGLDYHDMENQIDPLVTVDEYEAKMGKNSDIVTLSFVVKSEQAGNDLVNWFERGYDYVLDASLSEGEVRAGRYLVFVELDRRAAVPERIVELISDLKTLTDLNLSEWTVQVNDEDYDPDVGVLKQVIITSPGKYREEKEKDEENKLNEMRAIAGLDSKDFYEETEYKKTIKNMIGL